MKLVTSVGKLNINLKFTDGNVNTTNEGASGFFNFEVEDSKFDAELTPEEFNHEIEQSVDQAKHAITNFFTFLNTSIEGSVARGIEVKEKEINVKKYAAETDRLATENEKERLEINRLEAANREASLKLQQDEFNAKYPS